MPLNLTAAPPKAEQRPHDVTHHGVTLEDPYHWLKDPAYPQVTDSEILAHLEAENAYFSQAMAPLEGLKTTLVEELKGRIADEDSSVPQRDGAYVYQWMFKAGADYRCWQRWPHDAGSAQADIFFDEPARAQGQAHYVLGGLDISPNDRFASFGEDLAGDDRFTLRVKDLSTGELLADKISDVRASVVWASDSSGFFYTELDENHRPYCIKFHKLGDVAADDAVIYEEHDPAFFVGLGQTQDRAYAVVASGDHVTSEVRLIDLSDPASAPVLVAERRAGIDYSVDHGGGYLYILINDTHRNFRLVQTTLDASGSADWTEIESPSDTRYLRGVTAFKDYIVVTERIDGLDQLLVRSHGGAAKHYIEFPEASYAAGLGSNPEYAPEALRLSYQSMVTPPTVYDYNVDARQLTVMKVQAIPSGYDASQYETKRLMATGRDGAQIPISLVYKKGFETGQGAPLHLYGYGAYGLGMSPSFSSGRLSLLDRGFAFAIAHIRGGDELGYGWYQEGKMFKRWTTFIDFIDCADHLIEEGYAKRGQVSISGGSAGGTLMGVAHTIGADRWRAIVSHVPFVDVLNTMLDDSLPLTPIEWPEWGNPIEDPAAFALIKSYSPYENVREGAHVPMLVTGGLSDPYVTYWEPVKWVQRLRDANTEDNPILLKVNMGAGHQGKSGRYTALEETAEEYAFLLSSFGLE